MATPASPLAARASRSSALAQAREAFDSGDFQRARVLAQEAVRASDTTRERAAESARPRSEGSSRAEAERLAHEAIRIARAAGSKRETALAELALAEIHRARGSSRSSTSAPTRTPARSSPISTTTR